MPSTPIVPIMFNVTLNAYDGPRPKKLSKNQRVVNIKRLFEKLSNDQHSYPFKLRKNTHNYVQHIQIDSVNVCLPGGRGCVGKERHGAEFHNRQVMTKNVEGLKENPTFKTNPAPTDEKLYGLIVLNGSIQYKDGKTGNISIPVDSSGVIGIRTGASKDVKITNSNMNVNNSFVVMINEIESLLFEYLGPELKYERPHKIEMINAEFNMYTNKIKSERPKIINFVKFLQKIHMDEEFSENYRKAKSPWLNKQDGPCVVKSTFKATGDLPTITMSPYGRVEILGAKSFRNMVKVHKLVSSAFGRLEDDITKASVQATVCPVPTKRVSRVANNKGPDTITSIKIGNDGEVYINGKRCAQNKKPIIVDFLLKHGAATKGIKTDLCKRIHDILVRNKSLEREPEARVLGVVNNKGPDAIISIKIGNDGEVYINGKRCAQNKKPIIESFLAKHGAATKGIKSVLCKRIQDILVRNKSLEREPEARVLGVVARKGPDAITSIKIGNDGEVYINGKRCAQNKKAIIVEFLLKHGATTKGIKLDLCKRIHDILVRNKSLQTL